MNLIKNKTIEIKSLVTKLIGSEGAFNAVMSVLFLFIEEVINLISLDRNNKVVYTFVYFHF